MDLTTALKPDIYRVVAVVMVPGFVAAAPWVSEVFWPELLTPATWEKATLPISITAFGIVLVSGLILENLGSRIELLIDGHRKKAETDLFDVWYQYLALPASPERIGHGYLRAILIRFKFELSMIPASIFALAGVFAGQAYGHGLGVLRDVYLCAGFFISSILFTVEAYCSAGVLAKVRRTLLDAARRESR